MDWGMKNRLSRIIKPKDGKTVMLAVDHGYFLGPTSGLEDAAATLKPLIGHADTLMLTRGILRTSVDPRTDVPIMLRVSGGTSVLFDDLSNEELTVSIKDAIRLNVAGVALSIFVGSPHEKQTLKSLADLIDTASDYGIPTLAVTAVGKEMARDVKYLSLACRIAAEMGADIVKTYYCEGLEKLIASCPVPVVVAGGKKAPEVEAMTLAFNSIQSGAVGVDMGRNIFQSDSPVGMIKAVKAIVHKGATVEEGMDIYRAEQAKKGGKN